MNVLQHCLQQESKKDELNAQWSRLMLQDVKQAVSDLE
jgi:hypothetical protein